MRSRLRNATPAVRALWSHHARASVAATAVPFASEPGVGAVLARLVARTHGVADPATVKDLMRRLGTHRDF